MTNLCTNCFRPLPPIAGGTWRSSLPQPTTCPGGSCKPLHCGTCKEKLSLDNVAPSVIARRKGKCRECSQAYETSQKRIDYRREYMREYQRKRAKKLREDRLAEAERLKNQEDSTGMRQVSSKGSAALFDYRARRSVNMPGENAIECLRKGLYPPNAEWMELGMWAALLGYCQKNTPASFDAIQNTLNTTPQEQTIEAAASPVTLAQCYGCGEELTAENASPSVLRLGSGGCRKCRSAYKKTHNSEAKKAYARAYYQKWRREVRAGLRSVRRRNVGNFYAPPVAG